MSCLLQAFHPSATCRPLCSRLAAGPHTCSPSSCLLIPVGCSKTQIYVFVFLFFAETRALWHLRNRVWPGSRGIRPPAQRWRPQKKGDSPRRHTARPGSCKCPTPGTNLTHETWINPSAHSLQSHIVFNPGRSGYPVYDGTTDEAQKDRNHR